MALFEGAYRCKGTISNVIIGLNGQSYRSENNSAVIMSGFLHCHLFTSYLCIEIQSIATVKMKFESIHGQQFSMVFSRVNNNTDKIWRERNSGRHMYAQVGT